MIGKNLPKINTQLKNTEVQQPLDVKEKEMKADHKTVKDLAENFKEGDTFRGKKVEYVIVKGNMVYVAVQEEDGSTTFIITSI